MIQRAILVYFVYINTISAWQLPFLSAAPRPPTGLSTSSHALKLRHALHFHSSDRSLPPLHRTYTPADLAALSIESDTLKEQVIRTTTELAWRPNDNGAFQAARRASYYTPRAISEGRALSIAELRDTFEGSMLQWNEEEIETPQVTDVATLATLGRMAGNAYSMPDNAAGWYDLDGKWNVVSCDRGGLVGEIEKREN